MSCGGLRQSIDKQGYLSVCYCFTSSSVRTIVTNTEVDTQLLYHRHRLLEELSFFFASIIFLNVLSISSNVSEVPGRNP